MASQTNEDENYQATETACGSESDEKLSATAISSAHPFCEWMGNLPPELQKISLCRLAIPGTHNSGSFSCEVTYGLSPDAPNFLKSIVKVPGFRSHALLSIVQGWTICQSWDISQQLEGGIRYFDLRISTRKGSDNLFIVHGLYGMEMGEMVREMNSFLKEHRSEVLLLDFNHFYGMATEHHMQLITLLLAEFGDKICARRPSCDVSLTQLWEEGKQVVILYHHKDGADFEEVWPGSCITSPWPNTDKMATCFNKLAKYHSQPQTGFFVTQGILTPSTETIFKQLLTGNLLKLSKPFIPSLLTWIQDSSRTCVHPPNIIISDFVDEAKFVQHVLDLNKHRL